VKRLYYENTVNKILNVVGTSFTHNRSVGHKRCWSAAVLMISPQRTDGSVAAVGMSGSSRGAFLPGRKPLGSKLMQFARCICRLHNFRWARVLGILGFNYLLGGHCLCTEKHILPTLVLLLRRVPEFEVLKFCCVAENLVQSACFIFNFDYFKLSEGHT
jgi:hypothetical protein